MSKVRFGLVRVHYAVLTEGDTPSWATPVAIPGAVNLDLSQEGGRENFYADNTTYYVAFNNNGYSGSLEVAKIPVDMLKDVFGYTEDTAGVLVEDSTVEPKPFALLFETATDDSADNTRVCLYRCFADRPNIGSATTEETKTPQTQTINISCVPVINGALDGKVSASVTSAEAVPYASWFSSVYIPA